MFDPDDSVSPEEQRAEEQDAKDALAGKVVAGIVLLPSLIVAFGFYAAGRWGRLRLSLLVIFAALIEIIIGAIWYIGGLQNTLWNNVVDFRNLGHNWPHLIFPLILLAIALGCVLGILLTWWEFREMKRSPHRLELEGDWMYHFTFRRTPWEISRRNRLIQQLQAGNDITVDRIPLGLNEKGDYSIVYQYEDEAKRHTMIAGNTGSGKSITLMSKIRSLIKLGVSVTIIDFKRDPEFATQVAEWVHEFGGDFRHFISGNLEDYDIKYSKGPCRYDPLASGTPTSKADMVLNMREYNAASAVYREAMKQLLQVLFNMLEKADRSKTTLVDWNAGGIYQLKSAATIPAVRELAIACQGTDIEGDAKDIFEQLKGKTQISHAMEELQGQLRTITASEYGQWMKYSDDESRNIDLLELSSTPGSVVMFGFDSDSEKEFSKFMGSLIMSDISATSAKRRNKDIKNRYAVLIDEFQILPAETVDSLLQKARASKLEVTLALQSFEMIAASESGNGEAHLKAMIDTCGSFIIHAGMSHDSAERLSKILGKTDVTIHRASNRNSNFMLSFNWRNKKEQTVQSSIEKQWIVDPSSFINDLSSPDPSNGNKSTAMYITKSCSDPEFKKKKKSGPVARVVWMIPSSDVLTKKFDASWRMVENLDTDEVVDPEGVQAQLEAPRKMKVAVTDKIVRPNERQGWGNDDDYDDYPSEEEDDGGWGIETIDDESEEDELTEDEKRQALNMSTFYEDDPFENHSETETVGDEDDSHNGGSTSFEELKKNLASQAEKRNSAKPKKEEKPVEDVQDNFSIFSNSDNLGSTDSDESNPSKEMTEEEKNSFKLPDIDPDIDF